MKKLLIVLLTALPLYPALGEYQSSLLVQTGQFRESDLIVRTVSDLESNKICLAFYVRTTGTSPAMYCYEGTSGFRTNINQVGHFKEGKLVIRKIKDSVNSMSCLVAYVSTSGTSPAIDCYRSAFAPKDSIVRQGHLREGDLDVHRVVDPDSTETCLIAFVSTNSTSPALICYKSQAGGKGSLTQTNQMREGDLIVRKVVDEPNGKECLISYVSTAGTRSHIHCFDKDLPAQPANPLPSRYRTTP
ncbi:MAG: hypothetical protein U9R74_04610 [Pseudomonadota bacterium]|nr:hypothetical protein [Pseudomonadota bacterium]